MAETSLTANTLRFGDMLLSKNLITVDQLNVALVEQKRTRRKLGEVLEYMGFLSHDALRDAVGASFGYSSISLSHIVPDLDAIHLVSEFLARTHQIMPVSYDATLKLLKIATHQPDDLMVIDQIRRQMSDKEIRIQPLIASTKDILSAIDHYYGYELSMDGILSELGMMEVSVQPLLQDVAYEHPIVRLLDRILMDAVKCGASDIHFEPEAYFVRIRYRLDGVLQQIRLLHISLWSALLVRIKILSGLDIAETRLPQDGDLHLLISAKEVDFRVATHPVVHGENVVIRVLDREKGIVPLSELGVSSDDLASIHQMIHRPTGIIIMTGPTGSGKTTTLYAMIHQINQMGLNIMTLEDPVEYPMPMVRQTTIHEGIGLDFSTGIRSIMRQDPDVLLVGEIRDQESAAMAMRAAMTGHLVFATLHANDSLSAIARLRDLGVDKSILVGNVNGIVSQRLVRKLCVHCRVKPSSDVVNDDALVQQQQDVFVACGCRACQYTGYKGRVALLEVVVFDTEYDDAMLQDNPAMALRACAQEKNVRRMRDAGFELVRQGVTSLDELARVIDLSARHG